MNAKCLRLECGSGAPGDLLINSVESLSVVDEKKVLVCVVGSLFFYIKLMIVLIKGGI